MWDAVSRWMAGRPSAADEALTAELEAEKAARRADAASHARTIAALTDDVARLRHRLETLSAFAVEASWHTLDLVYEGRDRSRRIFCLACTHTDALDGFGTRVDRCIFGGGLLVRHVCPACDCVFGALKYLDLPASLIDKDYAQLYAGYDEANSTEGEIRTFHALQPRPGGVYLNWGCGAWSQAIDRLRADGWDVWGYEPNAPTDSPYIVKRHEELSGPFDGIFSHNVIEHFLDPAAQFRDYARLLKPDGRMAHASPCYQWSFAYTRFHTFFPIGRAAEALARRTGFTVSASEEDGDFRVRVFDRAA